MDEDEIVLRMTTQQWETFKEAVGDAFAYRQGEWDDMDDIEDNDAEAMQRYIELASAFGFTLMS